LDADLQAEIDDAISQLQGLTGETVIFAGVSYPASASSMLNGTLEFLQGGAADIQNITVCVRQSILPIPPAINTVARFRGLNLRVKSVNDGGTIWEILLIQEFA
jgi:hypothetical protein